MLEIQGLHFNTDYLTGSISEKVSSCGMLNHLMKLCWCYQTFKEKYIRFK